MFPYGVLELRYYVAVDGRSPFEEWFPRDIEQAKALWADYKRRRKPPAR